MAAKAECSDIGEIAFAAAFGNGHDVIGIPQAAPGHLRETPGPERLQASGATLAADAVPFGFGVDVAKGADAAIALEGLPTEVAGIAAEFPFSDAVFRAEGETALGNFQIAPAAEGAAIFAGRQF